MSGQERERVDCLSYLALVKALCGRLGRAAKLVNRAATACAGNGQQAQGQHLHPAALVGCLVCSKDLSLPGHPDILVTGDMMSLDRLPGVAEVGMQTGLYAGRSVTPQAQDQAYDKPFRHHDLGSAAYISRGRAVIPAGKLHFGGFPGWLAWLFIHIGLLTGYRNGVGAVLGW